MWKNWRLMLSLKCKWGLILLKVLVEGEMNEWTFEMKKKKLFKTKPTKWYGKYRAIKQIVPRSCRHKYIIDHLISKYKHKHSFYNEIPKYLKFLWPIFTNSSMYQSVELYPPTIDELEQEIEALKVWRMGQWGPRQNIKSEVSKKHKFMTFTKNLFFWSYFWYLNTEPAHNWYYIPI